MRLLLTRAAEDSARTRAKLEAAGHHVLVSPVIEIAPTGAYWPEGVVDAVLATSGHAFAVMAGWPDPAPEVRRLMPLFLVGERTAEVAREHGFSGPTTIAATAAILADVMISARASMPRRILYIAGRHRKSDLEAAFDAIGHHLDVLEIYEARDVAALDPDAVEALSRGTVGAVLHFSRRSAGRFAALARTAELDIQTLTHLCLSEDVATPLKAAGCLTIAIAAAPNEAALLALVEAP